MIILSATCATLAVSLIIYVIIWRETVSVESRFGIPLKNKEVLAVKLDDKKNFRITKETWEFCQMDLESIIKTIPHNSLGWPTIEPEQMNIYQLFASAQIWSSFAKYDRKAEWTGVVEFRKYDDELLSRGYLGHYYN